MGTIGRSGVRDCCCDSENKIEDGEEGGEDCCGWCPLMESGGEMEVLSGEGGAECGGLSEVSIGNRGSLIMRMPL